MSDPYTRWQQGAEAAHFTPAEAGALAEFLMQRHYPAYSNPRHLDHEAVSKSVMELHQRAAPGFIGPSGAVCDAAPHNESLLR